MDKIIDRIIRDTHAGHCKWSCGSHSDLWDATGPGYTLSQSPGGIWYTYFWMSVKGGGIRIKIGLGDWNRLRSEMTPKELPASSILERMN